MGEYLDLAKRRRDPAQSNPLSADELKVLKDYEKSFKPVRNTPPRSSDDHPMRAVDKILGTKYSHASVERAAKAAERAGQRDPALEKMLLDILSTNAEGADNTELGSNWSTGRSPYYTAMTSAVRYARRVIGEPWPELEPHLLAAAKNAVWGPDELLDYNWMRVQLGLDPLEGPLPQTRPEYVMPDGLQARYVAALDKLKASKTGAPQ